MRLASKRLLVPAIVLAGIGIAACSSNSSVPATTGSASTTGSTGTAAGLAAARATIADADAAPASIGVHTPLKTPAPAGDTFVWLRCDFAQCGYTQVGVAAAVQALHWNLKVIDFNAANPATLIAAMNQALQYHPVAVSFNGNPYATWSQEVPAYEKAGVAIIPNYIGPAPLNKAVIADLANPADLAGQARSIAAWMAVDSGGSGKALVLGVPSLPAIGAFPDDFESALRDFCPACTTTTLSASESQVANPTAIDPLIVSAVQRDRSIKYVIVPDGGLTPGLPAALTGAGISGVKIAGAQGSLENMTDIKIGSEQAFMAQDFTYLGWLDVDVAVRHVEGMAISPGDGGLLTQLITKSNVGTPELNLDKPADYQQEFERLWQSK